MPEALCEIFRRLSRPMEPLPTGRPPQLDRLSGIRAVLFDIYGTLLISGSGEVGTARQSAREDAFAEALQAVGLTPCGPIEAGLRHSFDLIERSHAEGRARGIDFPEIDILNIWDAVLGRLQQDETIPQRPYDREDLKRLAIEYEARTNPVWPMPDLDACLEGLAGGAILLGLVSNAQFYTRELFPGLVGRTTDECGFAADLGIYSYQQGFAKPGDGLYRLAAERLADRGISPSETVYVGNDMLNDITPAQRAGFKTALFAGDSRSLRLREGDPRVDGIRPDLILARLLDLNGCILD